MIRFSGMIRLMTMAMIVWNAVPVAAQEPPATALDSLLRTGVSGSWHLRLTTATTSFHGRILGAARDTVQLVGSRVPVDAIIRVERRLKEGGGALTGALIGGSAAGSFGFLISGLCTDGDCGLVRISATAIGAGIGAILGGLVGSIAWPPDVTWQPLWEPDS